MTFSDFLNARDASRLLESMSFMDEKDKKASQLCGLSTDAAHSSDFQ